ncbi:hypothetical protein AAFF_G00032750 [Aldrovandia affinis]|uniref:Uncharacterized protein n=1 Tax=Aldrovandia affinis TaxID=143900 RepID=A0AAD7R2E7_9TELE|nr:hypothetical protein AAFF_G00032750 [Aldrovandia affinis]
MLLFVGRFQREGADQKDGLIHLHLPECYFDPDAVVWRAVREIIQELARLPVTRQHSLSEVVVDTVTSLFRTVMDDGEEPSNQTESSRPLSGVAVGATVTVLQDVHAVECRAMQEFPMQYSV